VIEDILCAHYSQCMKYHIGVLVKKSLLKICQWNYHVAMHDLIEDMGKEIVRQESLKEPRKRSRLWFHEDIFQVLEENSVSTCIDIFLYIFNLGLALLIISTSNAYVLVDLCFL
jgi:hypothetical protein